MISEAIKKIDEEMEGASAEIRTLGKYVKEVLLSKVENAVHILKPNTDLETFMERLESIAKNIHGKKYHKDFTEAGKQIIADILGEQGDNVPESKIKLIGELANTPYDSTIVLSSEFIIPLLHIYYGIDNTSQKEPKPKRRSFRAVSLDD